MKDLTCLSELPLIPMLHQSEQSAMAVVFSYPASRISWLNSLEFILAGAALGEI